MSGEVVGNEQQLCKYEQQRLAHIRRNQEFMVQMGLQDAVQLANATKKTPQTKKRPVVVHIPESLRRKSARKQNLKPDYTGERIDAFGI